MGNKTILENIRILDFSWVLAGPYATRLMADFGAEVIKIQSILPGVSDSYEQAYYNAWNRNKLGITLNLNHPEGIEIAKNLVKISDIVLENFSPRVMTNWGMSYHELKNINPAIIMASLSIMGHTGPWQGYTGFGPAAQAFSGVTYLTAYRGQPPSGIGFSYADHVAGLYASLALMGALEFRRRTGNGQFIDLSETEAMAGFLSDAIQDFTLKGKERQPAGNSSDSAAPHGVYACQGVDRWCAISVTTEKEWEGLKRALGHPECMEDTRFAALHSRLRNDEELDNLVQAWTREHGAEEVMTILQSEGVPAGVIQSSSDLAHDPQLKSRGFYVGPVLPALGETIADATPIRLSDSRPEYRCAAPTPGQDNDYVYTELLKLSKDEVNRLRREKVI